MPESPEAPPKLSGAWARLREDQSLQGADWSAAACQLADDWLGAAFARAISADQHLGPGREGLGLDGARPARAEKRLSRLGRRDRSPATGSGPAGASSGLALMAVGSLGRRDVAPASDLDLLLVHGGRADVVEVADRLWYPIWDDPMPLDHSVRTLGQVEQAAESDLRVAQGLLDARLVAGDPELGAKVVELGRRLWQKRVGRWLPEVLDARQAAWGEHGDVAFLLEPEMQEGRGGLRDLQVLGLIAAVTPVLPGLASDGRLGDASRFLHCVRVELQRMGGHRSDRLLLEDQERVAGALDLAGREEVAHRVAAAGRDVAWRSEDAHARARSWLAGPRGRRGSADRPLGPGLVLRDNEVAVPVSSSPGRDPSLALRAATASAQLGVPLARSTMARLSAEPPVVPSPWDEGLRRAFIDLLGTGAAGTHPIETLDQLGLWELYMPEWPQVRNRPQFNPYHRWSVDRHLLEAVAAAADHVRRSRRPDLLLLGALLHDVGKGSPGDHSVAGEAIAADVMARIGFGPTDARVVRKVVRYHLLLPEVATRRDLEDPATVRSVTEVIEDETTLEILADLAVADGEATGASAWSEWKANLVQVLCSRCQAVWAGQPVPEGEPFPNEEQRAMLLLGGTQVVRQPDDRLIVVAPDRPGLFSDIAGALALHGLGVLEARVHSQGNSALEVFTLDLPQRAEPRWDRTTADIQAAAAGRLNVAEALARRPAPRPRRSDRALVPADWWVWLDNQSATGATLVEVHAPDAPGVLHRVTGALAAEGLDIVSARAATIGGAVVDTFYVRSAQGQVEPQEALEHLRARLYQRLSQAGSGPATEAGRNTAET